MPKKTVKKIDKFPKEDSILRLRQYGVYERLLEGDHYSAYMSELGSKFSDRYKYLKYMTCNFAGLLSKVIADVLFGEKVVIESKEKNKKEQDFINAIVQENNLSTQLYESALLNSARGDAVLRVRVEDSQIKVEDINPAMYFPELTSNFREDPDVKVLAWREEFQKEGGKLESYLIKEKYTKGLIETSVYLMKEKSSQEVLKKVAVKTYNEKTGKSYKESVKTGIEEIPIVHIPNFRTSNKYFGASDYQDLQSLFFGINNRMTKVDNILDKHSDPILAVPEGILDEDNNVKKEALGMVEKGEDGEIPEYIVWNANLEVAFTQIDEMIKMIFLFGEVSPDVVGMDMGKGGKVVESGRALKLRMLRTLAKKNRKALYYELGIQKAIEIASLFAKKGNKAGEVGYKGEPIIPNVIFADGVVDDKVEEITNESVKIDSGLTSRKRAIKVIEDMDDEEADAVLKEIKEENKEKADISDEAFHLRARVDEQQGVKNEGQTVQLNSGQDNKKNNSKNTSK